MAIYRQYVSTELASDLVRHGVALAGVHRGRRADPARGQRGAHRSPQRRREVPHRVAVRLGEVRRPRHDLPPAWLLRREGRVIEDAMD